MALLIPYKTLETSFGKKLLTGDLTMLEGAKRSVPQIQVHIESPPPPHDEDDILPRLDPYFRASYPDAKITRPGVRLKLWKVQAQIFRERCRALGIVYLSAPAQAFDDKGFLLPELISSDSCTHANVDYGKLVARQLEEFIQ